ncbi:MAG: hypoxanthine phosphoribosyltransferase [Bacteroidales bacterium]|nr:hypoxanthine phosphoribosyltransferase [Bacteroidales bacterium]MBN2748970.1 hypoxanthine phosphoribosyltransferase [Bacteroidales bacterium]
MKTVKLWDKTFALSYSNEAIQKDVEKVAESINSDFSGEEQPIFLSVLNGSFMFTADLLKRINFPCEVSFVKLASYQGTSSTGDVNQLIGLTENLEGKHVIIVEDIVDTGHTLTKLYKLVQEHRAASVRIATLLYKPESYHGQIKIDYIGKTIPNDFIVGYGLDYDGLGRNLADIYTLA